jgi:hypothetical protein
MAGPYDNPIVQRAMDKLKKPVLETAEDEVVKEDDARSADHWTTWPESK